jgi:misacylated tRNA(Ala) deacylase
MSRAFYHDNPGTLLIETKVLDAVPGKVLLAQSPFFPGGGGQLADRGVLHWEHGQIAVSGFEKTGGKLWHLLADSQARLAGHVQAAVDTEFRQMMTRLHTATHILNAIIFQEFNGALVTGVQMNDDGTARMDFDLPDTSNERLRAIDDPINAAIRQDLAVSDSYISLDDAYEEHGLIRTRSVMPPPTMDGKIRIVEIAGLDRQACGGTHLASTGGSGPVHILKIDNKGRRNRRIKIGLVDRRGG